MTRLDATHLPPESAPDSVFVWNYAADIEGDLRLLWGLRRSDGTPYLLYNVDNMQSWKTNPIRPTG